MIQVTEIKPGTAFRHEGEAYICLEMSHNKTAMRQMIVKAKSKNLKTGTITEITFSGAGKVEPLFLDKRKMQYLYDDGTSLIFMDMDSFEQIYIDRKRLTWELNFIVEQSIVDITSLDTEVIGIDLPAKVILSVSYTEPATKGDTAKTAMKDATLETGLQIKVPLFVNIGDKLIIRTDTGTYDSRA